MFEAVAENITMPKKTDNSAIRAKGLGRLASNAVIYTLANVASSAVPFLLLPLLTRVLTPGEYGIVSMYSTLLVALGAIAGLSVHGAVGVRMFDRETNHSQYIGTVLQILALSLFLVLLVVLICAPWLGVWLGLPTRWLVLAVLAAGAQFLINTRLVIWQIEGKVLHYGSLQFTQAVLNVVLSLLMVLHVKLGWEGRLAGITVALYLCALWGGGTLFYAKRINWRFNREYARDALRFGIPLMPHAIGSLFIGMGDRMVIANQLSLNEVGIYTAAMQLGVVISIIADAASKAFSPWIYSALADNDDLQKQNVISFTYVYWLALLMLALAIAWFSPLVLSALGESFRSGRDILAWVALGSAFSGMYFLVVVYVFYSKRNELLSITSLTIGIANLVMSYLLVGKYGAVGAAQAYATSQFLMFFIVWMIASRCCPMPWQKGLHHLLSKTGFLK